MSVFIYTYVYKIQQVSGILSYYWRGDDIFHKLGGEKSLCNIQNPIKSAGFQRDRWSGKALSPHACCVALHRIYFYTKVMQWLLFLSACISDNYCRTCLGGISDESVKGNLVRQSARSVPGFLFFCVKCSMLCYLQWCRSTRCHKLLIASDTFGIKQMTLLQQQGVCGSWRFHPAGHWCDLVVWFFFFLSKYVHESIYWYLSSSSDWAKLGDKLSIGFSFHQETLTLPSLTFLFSL